MILKEKEVVFFRMGDFLVSLKDDQDTQKIRSYDKKTGRITNIIKEPQTGGSFCDLRFPDGFVIKKISTSHLKPIRAKRYSSKKTR